MLLLLLRESGPAPVPVETIQRSPSASEGTSTSGPYGVPSSISQTFQGG